MRFIWKHNGQVAISHLPGRQWEELFRLPARLLLVRWPRWRLGCHVAVGRYLREACSSERANTVVIQKSDLFWSGPPAGAMDRGRTGLGSEKWFWHWLPWWYALSYGLTPSHSSLSPTFLGFFSLLTFWTNQFCYQLSPEPWVLVTTLYLHWASERTLENRCRRLCSPSLLSKQLWPSSSFGFSEGLWLLSLSSCSWRSLRKAPIANSSARNPLIP